MRAHRLKMQGLKTAENTDPVTVGQARMAPQCESSPWRAFFFVPPKPDKSQPSIRSEVAVSYFGTAPMSTTPGRVRRWFIWR